MSQKCKIRKIEKLKLEILKLEKKKVLKKVTKNLVISSFYLNYHLSIKSLKN